MLVGLAGRTGAGKSTVAARLAEHGAAVIDADRIAHQVLETEPVRAAIADRFGSRFLDDTGRVCRAALAAAVFGPDATHAAALADLEAIVHPPVRAQIEATIDGLRKDAGDQEDTLVIVLDVPLLVQTGWAPRCDCVIEVACSDAIRRKRLLERGWSVEAIACRDAAWMRRMPAGGLPTVVDPARMATVDTSSDISYTQSQVDRIWQRLRTGLPR